MHGLDHKHLGNIVTGRKKERISKGLFKQRRWNVEQFKQLTFFYNKLFNLTTLLRYSEVQLNMEKYVWIEA